jgi:hypothetical protein
MSIKEVVDSVKNGLDSFNAAIDRIQKAPLLISFIFLAAYHVWRMKVQDAAQERQEYRVERVNNQKDSVTVLYMREQAEKSAIKDTVYEMKIREFRNLIERMR